MDAAAQYEISFGLSGGDVSVAGLKKFGHPSHCAATSAKDGDQLFRAGRRITLNLSRASLTALLFLTLIDPCRADPAPVIHYAPAENLEHVDVALIDSARHEIDMAAYVLIDWPVMQALILHVARIGRALPTHPTGAQSSAALQHRADDSHRCFEIGRERPGACFNALGPHSGLVEKDCQGSPLDIQRAGRDDCRKAYVSFGLQTHALPRSGVRLL
jgi:hypothetical protein